MKAMRQLRHDNVNTFMGEFINVYLTFFYIYLCLGIIIFPSSIYVVREFCPKCSLFDILKNDEFKLDELYVASFVEDLIKVILIYIYCNFIYQIF